MFLLPSSVDCPTCFPGAHVLVNADAGALAQLDLRHLCQRSFRAEANGENGDARRMFLAGSREDFQRGVLRLLEPGQVVVELEPDAVLEARSPVPAYSNLPLRLEAVNDAKEVPELYAKVLRSLDESANRYLIQFTSVPPGVRAWLDRVAGADASP